ncbi:MULTISPECIES: FHA domain-containing protein [unclassified Streptomyces]|uniref:FHA domain-containing protein n=1 Tax=unclassified Streptomyces TaxID=2593676 RepID=UPI000FFF3FB9|nr:MULTISPECIES: FHA domain-containing protein [unclassified Streptomyces]
MPTCPNGHQSGSDDWCEVCGHRMAGAVPPPPPPPPPGGGYGFPPPGQGPQGGGRGHLSAVPDPEPELCPQCRTPREGGAPFCEECRWNFLTNTATSYTPAAPRPPAPGPAVRFQPPPGPGGPGPGGPGGPGPSYGGGDSYEYQGSRPSQMNRPAEPIPPSPPYGSDPQSQGRPFGDPSGFGSDPSGYGQDPSRQAPPPPGGPGGPGPGGQGGPGSPNGPGAPQAFHQPGPPAPPGYPQETGRPQQPGGPSFGGGDDDWVIPPPSGGPQGPGGPGGPGAPGGPGQGGGYGYPQAGATQAPPGQGFPQPPAGPATWMATIGPDREYFMAMMQRSGPEAAGLNLPAYSPEQQRTLSGNQITIGRRRHSTGDTPDIDLAVPPEDPGVSHQHAVLVQQPDGSWAVVDQNSTNGTTVNNSEEPIQPFVPVPLQDGDKVHVGAWTTITIRRG